MKQNLTEKIFGRPAFAGTGSLDDYFPNSAPDLGYLGQQRPDFIPEGHSYDPSLDPENLVRNGVSVPEAMQLQQLRANIHQNAAQQRIDNDARGAMEAMKGVDFTSPHHPNELLKIFSQFPNARKSKEVLDQMNFFKSLKPEETSLDIEALDDPIDYNFAKANNLAKLPKKEAERKLASHKFNRQVLAKAIENNLTEEDLADSFDKDAGIYDPIKADRRISEGRYDISKETNPRVLHAAIKGNWGKLSKSAGARAKAIHELNMGIEDTAEEIGVAAEDLAQFKDEEGLLDPGKVKGYLRQYQSSVKPTSSDVLKYTKAAQEERTALMSPEGKLQLLQEKYGNPKQTEFSKEDWDWAHEQAKNTKTPSEVALESLQAPRPMGGKPAKTQSTEKAWPGMKVKGNLDPFNRKVLDNHDGTSSTTSSISIGTDQGEVLIPTVVDGVRLSEKDAIAHYKKTGEHLGIFDTPDHADAYATDLHNRQADSVQFKSGTGRMPSISSKADYDALPDGAKFMWNGKPVTKGEKLTK